MNCKLDAEFPRYLNENNTACNAFFADTGMEIFSTYNPVRTNHKLLGFICFKAPISANYVGHFTVLRPYYFENYWKWFYLDSFVKVNFNFKKVDNLKELTVNEAKEKFKTFFVTSWGHNNMLFAFYIKKSVEQKEVEEPDYDDVNL